ncbi:MAG: hypothetical protein FWC45_01230 [Treponema sp.]|nr:hypothetical protein [Treponema sp.]
MVILYSGSLKAGESWHSQVLELSPPKGSENFYVVVTRDEQKNLAARIAAFNASSASAQKRALMNEVYRVRRDVSQFKEAPEKPVLMGGAARGAPERSQGVAFSGLSAYVKTISIEH